MRKSLPNFRGSRALVLHRKDKNRETLVRQLKGLGLTVETRWPADGVTADDHDVIFFDADLGYQGLFAWPAEVEPPVPLIALMGSEAPGRIEWTLAQTPSAYLIKPLGSTGVFIALAIAFHAFEARRQMADQVEEMDRRIKARPLVFAAQLMVMERFGVDGDKAFELLRSESMNRSLPLESLCAQLASRRIDIETIEPKREGGASAPGGLKLVPGRKNS